MEGQERPTLIVAEKDVEVVVSTDWCDEDIGMAGLHRGRNLSSLHSIERLPRPLLFHAARPYSVDITSSICQPSRTGWSAFLRDISADGRRTGRFVD